MTQPEVVWPHYKRHAKSDVWEGEAPAAEKARELPALHAERRSVLAVQANKWRGKEKRVKATEAKTNLKFTNSK